MARLSLLAAVGAISLPLLAGTTSAGAASPRTTPPIGRQLAELEGPNIIGGLENLGFGYSVAISGTTVVVGAYGTHTGAGRAYVFTKTATGWTQTPELKGSDTVGSSGTFDGDVFGYSVAIAGTTVVVGAPGHAKNTGRAYVFTKTRTGWKQAAELKGSNTVFGSFGYSVAISGTTVVVGAPSHANGPGRAYVFTKMATRWTQTAELKGSDTVGSSGTFDDDVFGDSVAISGSTIVVGAANAMEALGEAYVFTKTAPGWKQTAELKGGDDFGISVAISGTTAVVGEPIYYVNSAGLACVFTKTAGAWRQVAGLKGSDTVAGDQFGDSVAISGTTAVVGAGNSRAYVFTKTAGAWRQVAGLKGSDIVAGDGFGGSVAISGTTAVVGAGNSRAYVFEA
jgi:hypothetical protein